MRLSIGLRDYIFSRTECARSCVPRRAARSRRLRSLYDPVHQLLMKLPFTLERHRDPRAVRRSEGCGRKPIAHLRELEYVTDEHVHPDIPEHHVNVNCVLSWRRADREVQINFWNGWVYDSRAWRGFQEGKEAVHRALLLNDGGKVTRGHHRADTVTGDPVADACAEQCAVASAYSRS